jgi:PAS domain S-box-containing protein/diguanylate cyclase (GGDEF)-like protein
VSRLPRLNKPAARIVLAYLAVSGLWILASDSVVELVAGGSPLGEKFQTFKGLAFILVTGALLYLALARSGMVGDPRVDAIRPPTPWLPIAGFALFTLGLLFTGWFTFHTQRAHLRASAEASLRAVGDLKRDQIARWLAMVRANARHFGRGSQTAENFAVWQAGGERDASRLERIRGRLDEIAAAYGYRSISLFDLAGRFRLSDRADPDMDRHGPEALRAMASGEPILVDFHIHGADLAEPMLGMMAPLIAGRGAEARTVGAMFFAIPAGTSLLPLLGHWPGPSTSGETVLARREGTDVRVLYASRREAGPGLGLGPLVPGDDPRLPSLRLLAGDRGILADSTDFRNKPVLAYGNPVAGTPWVLVAKQDQDEVDAPVHRLARTAALLGGLLLAIAGTAFWLWWRATINRQRAQLLGQELERHVLERHFDYLSRYANDVILLLDDQGRVMRANDRVGEVYGYPPEELVGQPVSLLRPPEDRVDLDVQIGRIASAGQAIYETVHVRGDGSRLPVEVSGRMIDVEGMSRIHLSIRDITERKRAEAALLQRAEPHRRIVETANEGIWSMDGRHLTSFVNRHMADMLGYTPGEMLGLPAEHFLFPEDLDDYRQRLAQRENGASGVYERRLRRRDGSECWCLVSATALKDVDGGFAGSFAMVSDITALKRMQTVQLTTAEFVSSASGETFFEDLVRHAAENLGFDYVHVALLVPGQQRVATLAAWLDGQPVGNWSYDLACTPCAEVLSIARRCIPSGVRSLFPDDRDLDNIGAESYVGEPLVVSGGRVIGLVVGITRAPLRAADMVQANLRILAARAATEWTQREAVRALTDSETRFRRIVETANEGIWQVDANWTTTYVNRRMEEMLGCSPGAMLGRPIEDFMDAAGRAQAEEIVAQRLAGVGETHDFRFTRVDGAELHALVSASPIQDDAGQPVGAIAMVTDITARRRAEERLRQAVTVFENTRDGIMVTDAEGGIVAVNRAFSEITGYGEAEALGRNPRILKSERTGPAIHGAMWAALLREGHWSGEIWNRRKDGEEYPEWLTVNAVRDADGRTEQYIAVFTDLSTRYNLQAELDYQSHHSQLTGLPNARALLSRVQQAGEAADAEGGRLALLVLNIDRFAQLNETLGRSVGDQVLLALTRRWSEAIGDDCLLTHQSADQFAVLRQNVRETHDAIESAARLLDSMREPVAIDAGGKVVALTLSIGVALYPEDARDPGALLHAAEDAMRSAKADKGNQVRFFDRGHAQTAIDWFETENALRHALERDEFFLAFQPQVDAATGRPVAAEALLRWRRDGEVLLPGRFIHVVEGTDLAEPVSRWVLEAACRQARLWLDRQRPLRVAVNIFTDHVTSGHLLDDVRRALDGSGLPPRLLELEVVESSLLKNPETAARTLREIKRLGVGLALDDFGTGYSSLGYLKHYPFDVLKIDQIFARNVTRDPEDAAIVRSTISLAHNLGMRVLAEGVETEPQLRFMARYGCDQLQGYLFCRPTGPEEVETRVMERRDLRPSRVSAAPAAKGVLIVEDEPVEAKRLTLLLEEEGYRVHATEDLDGALDVMGRERIDLILSDHYLRDSNGVELLEQMRRLFPDVPRIMASGAEEQMVVVDAINRAGIRAFLSKPVDPDTLFRTVRKLITEVEREGKR